MVVVGAGPAGTTAARLLAERGAHVRLLEARRLPRHKLCGGGLTPKAIPFLPPSALDCVERRVVAFELAGGRLGRPVLRLPDVEIAMVERAPFDAALADAAVRAGVDLVEGEPVVEARPGAAAGTRPAVVTRDGTIEADVVIAADGEPSRVATRAGLRAPARRRALALEVDLPLDPARSTSALQLRFGVPDGYAWYFPKRDHANVGILTTDPVRTGSLTAALRRYVAELGSRSRGGPYPRPLDPDVAARRSARVRAGCCSPATPPGPPIRSSARGSPTPSRRVASRPRPSAIGRMGGVSSLHAYEPRVRRALEPTFARLGLVGRIADTMPSLAIAALAAIPWARGEARRGLLGLGSPFALSGPPLRGRDVNPPRAPRA